jgi:hypothetical protein
MKTWINECLSRFLCELNEIKWERHWKHCTPSINDNFVIAIIIITINVYSFHILCLLPTETHGKMSRGLLTFLTQEIRWKLLKAMVLLGLCKSVPLPSPPLFSSSSTSCNLLQISERMHSNMHSHQLVLCCNLLRPYSTEASNYHSNRGMWCLCAHAETKHLLWKNYTRTHTLICNMKFYFMVFMKGIRASN